MTQQVVNQGLFRLYSAFWFVAAASVVGVAWAATEASGSVVAIYAAIGFGLWLLDMMLTKGGPRGHALSHAMLVAASAAVWPLTIVALAAWGGVTVVREVRL